jgi:hypothetical protein
VKSAKRQPATLTDEDHWEIECLQRQFPEHSPEEILWAFQSCKGDGADKATLVKCVKRQLNQ